MIISAATPKGGTGKTTSMALLASALLHGGKTICIIDNDPNRLMTEWVKGFPDAYADRIFTHYVGRSGQPEDVSDTALELEPKYDMVLIDLEGISDAYMREGIRASAFTLIPLQASAADEAAVPDVVRIIASSNRDSLNPTRYAFVINRVPGAIVTNELVAMRRRIVDGGKPLLTSNIPDKEAFRKMFRLDLPLFDPGMDRVSGIETAREAAIRLTNDISAELTEEIENA